MELETAVGKHEKLESFKIRNEIGKYKVGAEVEKYSWNCEVTIEVEKFSFKLERTIDIEKLQSKLQWQLSKFRKYSPTSFSIFQLNWKLINLRLFNLEIKNFSFFPTTFSNYM